MADAAEFIPATDLATTPRVVVRFQADRCQCGCEGADYWHREVLARTLREITTLSAPRPLPLADRASRDRVVLATATARAPWGQDVEVWAIAYAPTGAKFAEWQYSALPR